MNHPPQTEGRDASRPPPLGRRAALDGLRGVAIVLVMLFHLMPRVFPAGFLGVDIFFVLSGFLITTLLLTELDRTGHVSLSAFYLRRARRLLPALYALIVAVGAWELLGLAGAGPRPLHGIAYTALYASNFGVAHSRLGMFVHTWSLAQEEQFYFFWPVALLALTSWRGRRAALWFALLCAAAVVALRAFAWRASPDIDHLYHLPQYRVDGMMLGCALAIARSEGMLPRPGRVSALLALAALLLFAAVSTVASMGSAGLYLGGFTLFAALAAVLLFELVERPTSPLARALSMPRVVRVGELSYSLYLWHYPVGVVLTVVKGRLLPSLPSPLPLWGRPLVMAFVPLLAFPLSWALASLSHRFIEVPGQRLGLAPPGR